MTFFLSVDHNYERDPDTSETDLASEVLISKDITIHRTNLVEEVISIFTDETILKCNLRITLIDHSENIEAGIGDGVAKDVICTFFNRFITSHIIGLMK